MKHNNLKRQVKDYEKDQEKNKIDDRFSKSENIKRLKYKHIYSYKK